MKRYILVKNLIESFKDNDVAIFAGKELCKEAYQYDRPGNFYIEDSYGSAISIALGAAMCTEKRIFIVVGEGDFLRDLSVASQLSASKCANIFLIVLDNGIYQDVGNLPNIMHSMKSKRGVMFNLGLIVFDFTVYLRKREFKKMRDFMKNIRGPIVIFFDVDAGKQKDLENIKISKLDQKERLMKFLANKEMGTSLHKITGPSLHVKDVKPEVLANVL